MANTKPCNCFCASNTKDSQGRGTLYGDGTNKVQDQAACQGSCDSTYGAGATTGFCK
jgi:hypothetical protein